MTHPYIKQFIEFVCYQFEKRIDDSDIQYEDYLDLLKKLIEKIKKQAEKSMEKLEQVDTIKLFAAISVKNDYLQSVTELNDAFQKYNIRKRSKITQAQLAPFQVDQFARQLALAPGIIIAYEHITGQKRQNYKQTL